jgi:Asp-tRNA(Asn)/Glu-tRNA(Gln) amidotransferase B subunit
MILWDDESFAKVEAALTPKQLKVVNFLFGQCMKADPEMRKLDPKLVKRVLIEKLSVAAYEETLFAT